MIYKYFAVQRIIALISLLLALYQAEKGDFESRQEKYKLGSSERGWRMLVFKLQFYNFQSKY